jgi:hypothetical protein
LSTTAWIVKLPLSATVAAGATTPYYAEMTVNFDPWYGTSCIDLLSCGSCPFAYECDNSFTFVEDNQMVGI